MAESTELSELMAGAIQQIDAELDRLCQFDLDCPQNLVDAMRYSLLAPGKRMRPLLVLWACEACGGNARLALPAAAAVEMVHAYSLIHDDLPAMDDDDLRRGRPTCHRQFGEGIAILAGDALLTLAFKVLASEVEAADAALSCCAVLGHAAGATQLVGGQADDLSGEFLSGNLQTLESIHRRKTGAMILASLRMGGIIAGASHSQAEGLDEYGRCLGLAFQIVDDLLDVCGSEAELGKRVSKDSEHGKLTFPAVLGIDESRRRAEELIERAIAALAPLRETRPLELLARYVLERKH